MITNYLLGNGILYNKKQNQMEANDLKAMASDNEKLKELKLLIRDELKDCNHIIWPQVCQMQSTEKGQAKLEDMIIRYIAEEGMMIGSAIALIEQELSHII